MHFSLACTLPCPLCRPLKGRARRGRGGNQGKQREQEGSGQGFRGGGKEGREGGRGGGTGEGGQSREELGGIQRGREKMASHTTLQCHLEIPQQ